MLSTLFEVTMDTTNGELLRITVRNDSVIGVDKRWETVVSKRNVQARQPTRNYIDRHPPVALLSGSLSAQESFQS